MAGQASFTIKVDPGFLLGNQMGIMATETAELVGTFDETAAGPHLLNMVDRARPFLSWHVGATIEYCPDINQMHARAKIRVSPTGTQYPSRRRKMALIADGFAPRGIEFSGVHDGIVPSIPGVRGFVVLDMVRARAVTPFATDGHLRKHRVRKDVGRVR